MAWLGTSEVSGYLQELKSPTSQVGSWKQARSLNEGLRSTVFSSKGLLSSTVLLSWARHMLELTRGMVESAHLIRPDEIHIIHGTGTEGAEHRMACRRLALIRQHASKGPHLRLHHKPLGFVEDVRLRPTHRDMCHTGTPASCCFLAALRFNEIKPAC